MADTSKEAENTQFSSYAILSKHKSDKTSTRRSEIIKNIHSRDPKPGQSNVPVVQIEAKEPSSNTFQGLANTSLEKEKDPDGLDCDFIIKVYTRALHHCRDGVIEMTGKHEIAMKACEDDGKKLAEENMQLQRQVEELRKEVKILKGKE